LSSLCFLAVASPAFPVMKCTPPAMIPSRSGFTFGHMGGIISVSPLAAALMPAMDLYLRKVVHLGPATTTARSSRTMASRSRSARSGFSTVRQLAPDMRGASRALTTRLNEASPDETQRLPIGALGPPQQPAGRSDCLAKRTHLHSTLGETVLQAARRDPETKTFYSRRRSTR
jgi:hypothetical protein